LHKYFPANKAGRHPDIWVPAERAVHRGGLLFLLNQLTILPFVALYDRRRPKTKKEHRLLRTRGVRPQQVAERQPMLFLHIRYIRSFVPDEGLTKPTTAKNHGALRIYEEHQALYTILLFTFTAFRP